MRILVADDQAKVRFALRVLLQQQPRLEVVNEATDGESLLVSASIDCPELVLLDWELPHLAGKEALTALRSTCPGVLVIALSGRPEVRSAALAAGADGFVCKCDPPERLLGAIAALWRE